MASYLIRFIVLALLALPNGGALAQSQGATFTGFLSVMWGDPPAGSSGGSMRAELTLPDGTTHPLKFSGGQQGMVAQLSGKRVQIRGHMTGEAPAAIVVDAMTPVAAGEK